MTWRDKWADTWDEVRHCSSRCRKLGVTAVDRRLEAEILSLLASRSGTGCPSEAARAVAGSDSGGC